MGCVVEVDADADECVGVGGVVADLDEDAADFGEVGWGFEEDVVGPLEESAGGGGVLGKEVGDGAVAGEADAEAQRVKDGFVVGGEGPEEGEPEAAWGAFPVASGAAQAAGLAGRGDEEGSGGGGGEEVSGAGLGGGENVVVLDGDAAA